MQRLAYSLTIQSDGLVRVRLTGGGRDERREAPLDHAQLVHVQSHLADIEQQTQLTRAKLATFGRYLYALLLTGSVRAHFEEVVWPQIRKNPPDVQLIFSLAFQESDSKRVSQTAVLPWEFLYYPHGNGTFLATDPRLCFTRRFRQQPPMADHPIQRIDHLRVVLVHLQPADAAPVSLTRIRNVLRELSTEETAVRGLTPVVIQNKTPTELADTLQKIRPHVLHLLLHGRFAPDSTRFAFVDGQGETRWYGDRSLADLFAQEQPCLVIVQACAGGRQEDAHTLAHGASWLMAAGVPTVVAIQYPITNEVGWEFAGELYRQLADGAAIDTAVQAGRRHLARYDLNLPDDHASRHFGAVILWQRPLHIELKKERKDMTQTVTLVTPDGQQYAADVFPDTLVGELVRAFVGQWQPTPTQPTYYTLHSQGPNQPPLEAVYSLHEAGVADGALLWLQEEQLAPDGLVGLTIEDDLGGRFATAVLLNTTVQNLAKEFMATRPDAVNRTAVVTLVTSAGGTHSEQQLLPEQTLYEAGISHDALLRIELVPGQPGGKD